MELKCPECDTLICYSKKDKSLECSKCGIKIAIRDFTHIYNKPRTDTKVNILRFV